MNNNSLTDDINEFMDLLEQGVIEYGCMYSMYSLGRILAGAAGGDFIHLAPW
jgi:hypothetical protein